MKITIDGNAKEVAALIAALQDTEELRRIRSKPFSELTDEEFAKLSTHTCAYIAGDLHVSKGPIKVK